MLEAIAQMSGKSIDRGFWKRLAKKQDLSHIEFKQMRHSYTASAEPGEASTGFGSFGLGGIGPEGLGPEGLGPVGLGPVGMAAGGTGVTGPEGSAPGSTGPENLGHPGPAGMSSDSSAPMGPGPATQPDNGTATPQHPSGSSVAAATTSDEQDPPESGREPRSQNGPEPGRTRPIDVANLKIAADGMELTDEFLESAEEN